MILWFCKCFPFHLGVILCHFIFGFVARFPDPSPTVFLIAHLPHRLRVRTVQFPADFIPTPIDPSSFFLPPLLIQTFGIGPPLASFTPVDCVHPSSSHFMDQALAAAHQMN
uniref:Uncharacterized protein n=1 Tax=Lactuca sativa TaxID=4236 RepID=A0A9R1WIE6_LACSA|nr:hypothetical protein LSAT_V11C200095050 [Lactuca sativa]